MSYSLWKLVFKHVSFLINQFVKIIWSTSQSERVAVETEKIPPRHANLVPAPGGWTSDVAGVVAPPSRHRPPPPLLNEGFGAFCFFAVAQG
jgi:hypothetical protein